MTLHLGQEMVWNDVFVNGLLRVPGHEPLLLDGPPAARVMVEPETVLFIRGRDLKGNVGGIELMKAKLDSVSGRATDYIAFGYVSPDCWGIALQASMMRVMMPSLDIELLLNGGFTLEMEHDLESGRSDTYVLPILPARSSAPLRVGLRNCTPSSSATARLLAHTEEVRVTKEPFGRAWLGTRIDRQASRTESGLYYSDLPIGISYKIAFYDSGTGCYCRESFVHDGSPLELVAHQATAVEGVLADPALLGHPLYARWFRATDSQCEHRADAAWDEGPLELWPEASGRFRFFVPSGTPVNDLAVIPPPGRMSLTLSFPGFQDVTHCIDATPSRVELGPIGSVPLPPDIVLCPGQISIEDLAYKPVETNVTSVLEIFRSWQTERGCIAVSLSKHSQSSEAKMADAIVVSLDGLTAFGFRRQPNGVFLEAPVATYRIRSTPDSIAGPGIAFGWQWMGVDHHATHLGRTPAELDLELRGPSEGVVLWWQLDGSSREYRALVPGTNLIFIR